MAFDEVRLPTCIEKGAQGGPQFNTTVLSLSSGYEKRNINWSKSRGSWDISYGIKKKEDLDELISFFYARRGRARGFRFRDFSDYKLARQGIGIGDGANAIFQIYKRYSNAGIDYDRIINKIVDNTLSVWVNNALIDSSDYAIDLDTGIITFDVGAIPAISDVVEVQAEFDVPVRFDIDNLNINLYMVEIGSLPQISVIELRLS